MTETQQPTSYAIALRFAETFQKCYPQQPLTGMMENLRKEIEEYAELRVNESQAHTVISNGLAMKEHPGLKE